MVLTHGCNVAHAAPQVATNRSYGDTVSAVVSPAVLATAVMHLSNWSYLQSANVLFGYYVAEKLEAGFPARLPSVLNFSLMVLCCRVYANCKLTTRCKGPPVLSYNVKCCRLCCQKCAADVPNV